MVPTVKHGGGNVIVWRAIGAAGVENLEFIDGIMNQHTYKSILESNLQASVDIFGLGSRLIFQQDNDPKHTALSVKEWLLYSDPRQLHSQRQSPDLNPIEHVWDIMKRKLVATSITSKKSLKEALKRIWSEISPSETESLVLSMPRRLQTVIDSHGGPKKY